MFEVILKLLLIVVIGIAMLIATFITADASGDWMERALYRLYQRWQTARIRVGWQEIAARHHRKVKA